MRNKSLSFQDIACAVESQSAYQMDPGKALLASQKITPALLASAQLLVSQIASSVLTEEEALKALAEVIQTNCDTTTEIKKIVCANNLLAKQRQAQIDSKNPFICARKEYIEWLNFPEFKDFIKLIVTLSTAATAIENMLAPPERYFALYILLIVGAIALMWLGRSWSERENQRILDRTRVKNSAPKLAKLAPQIV